MIWGVLWGVFWLDGYDTINMGDVGIGGDGGDGADKVAGRLTKGSTRGPCGPKKQLHLLILTKIHFLCTVKNACCMHDIAKKMLPK